ncbi:protein COFACTOR ASSEMBLY OF COMPLEX C SUBUNIT B CCB3, chloroplastic [Mercurialis annua]|uniref:protein COFACTOR ASSEMBLY OF COMPLEX C SUBUNIT B CCB3, chloroplastic n=1 Tax=Mercurialis annua TaxID=3986 RepID=UPI00215E44AA|nr:protein COFACTOR ASSEMBLY OF COMPLEX C SUBUNIT B CCB3, chloroplastic [Mercurialis annua]
MATCASLFSNTQLRGWRPLMHKKHRFNFSERFDYPNNRNPSDDHQVSTSSICHSAVNMELLQTCATLTKIPLNSYEDIQNMNINLMAAYEANLIPSLMLADIDPATAKLAISFLGPFLSAFGFLFIVRIVMSWYPKIPVGKFPYVIAYAPTEPILGVTRKVIPPVGGVDVAPVIWFGLTSFLNEILLGPQGLLVLISQQQVS